MPNDLTNVLPQILAQGLDVLSEAAVLPRLINTDWSKETAKKGAVISIPAFQDSVADDVAAAATPPAVLNDVAPETVEITLNKWKKSDFALSDKEIGEAMDGTIPKSLKSAAKALANQITNDCYALYKEVYGYAGVAGVTPFASDISEATATRLVLQNQLCDMDERRFVLGPDAAASALGLATFNNNNATKDAAVLTEGQLGRKLGFDFAEDQLVPTHTTGAAGAPLLDDNTLRAVGIKTLHMDGFTTKPSVGDIFTIAGDEQTYVVTAASNLIGTDSDVQFEPGLKVGIPAVDGNEVITFKASHVVNLAFNKYAFALAVRQLEKPVANLGPQVLVMQDARTGVAMRLTVAAEYMRTRWTFDVLYGVKCVRKEFAARCAG